MSGIRWGYAINQWKPQFDDFVRREQHERAFKTIAVAGFTGVELTSGTGRWEPLGNPGQLVANFGSLKGFRTFLGDCALDGVSSWFLDPQPRSAEHLTGPYSLLEPADVPGIVERAREFAAALAELGGSVLVVPAGPAAGDLPPGAGPAGDLPPGAGPAGDLPPGPAAGDLPPGAGPAGGGGLDDAGLDALAACWEAVGTATRAEGIHTALHVDFLSALRTGDALDQLLRRTDPDLVGLALDTGELTVAGLDPLAVVERHGDRIRHVQFKDALDRDTDEEYRQEHAHWTVRVRGGAREVPRWFGEPGGDGGTVDFAALTRALVAAGYSGWIVFESDQSPHPAASALLGGYLLQRDLRPLVSGKDRA
ncbi:sugar phosphate isomerase/epimerase [Cryptosporangium japonicum]|uniref:Xylose isomerase-like TIM barrel domain-containing protein n=1 Tax=Cryptosporangium japonicum TaxID=80872 RepID=A0ABN0UF24_9ACTN